MKIRCCVVLFASLLASGFSQRSDAATPWQKLLPFKKIDADPNKSYPVTESNGPWMILAMVFHGEDAERQARQLAFELRKKYKLEAYTHVQVFDYTKYGRSWGVNADGSPNVAWRAHEDDVRQVAVMVGNYGSLDDDRATETLKKIKSIEPESLRTDGAKSSQIFADLRQACARSEKTRSHGQRVCGHQSAVAARILQLRRS